jgi:O-antigen/teichoic acid export membrane protein
MHNPQKTVRQVFGVSIMRSFDILRGVLYVLVIPVLLTQNEFGKLAFITSLAFWFNFLGHLGIREISNRFFPEFQMRPEGVQPLFFSLYSFRMLSALFSSFLFFLVARIWAPEIPEFAVLCLALTILLESINQYTSASLMSINQSLFSGIMDTLRTWLSLVGMIVFYLLGGLRWIFLGMLIAECIVFITGLLCQTKFIGPVRIIFDWKMIQPYLRIGLIFYASQLLITSFFYGGEILLRLLTNDYRQIGHYAFAANIALTFAIIRGQLLRPFTPLLTQRYLKNQHVSLRTWVARLTRLTTILTFFLVLGTAFFAKDILQLITKTKYDQSIQILIILFFGLTLGSINAVAQTLMVALAQPGLNLINGLLRLLVFVAGILVSFPNLGVTGAAYAYAGSFLVGSIHFILSKKIPVKPPVKSPLAILILGTPIFLLSLMDLNLLKKVLGFCLAGILYLGILFKLKLFTFSEIKLFYQTLVRKNP